MYLRYIFSQLDTLTQWQSPPQGPPLMCQEACLPFSNHLYATQLSLTLIQEYPDDRRIQQSRPRDLERHC